MTAMNHLYSAPANPISQQQQQRQQQSSPGGGGGGVLFEKKNISERTVSTSSSPTAEVTTSTTTANGTATTCSGGISTSSSNNNNNSIANETSDEKPKVQQQSPPPPAAELTIKQPPVAAVLPKFFRTASTASSDDDGGGGDVSTARRSLIEEALSDNPAAVLERRPERISLTVYRESVDIPLGCHLRYNDDVNNNGGRNNGSTTTTAKSSSFSLERIEPSSIMDVSNPCRANNAAPRAAAVSSSSSSLLQRGDEVLFVNELDCCCCDNNNPNKNLSLDDVEKFLRELVGYITFIVSTGSEAGRGGLCQTVVVRRPVAEEVAGVAVAQTNDHVLPDDDDDDNSNMGATDAAAAATPATENENDTTAVASERPEELDNFEVEFSKNVKEGLVQVQRVSPKSVFARNGGVRSETCLVGPDDLLVAIGTKICTILEPEIVQLVWNDALEYRQSFLSPPGCDDSVLSLTTIRATDAQRRWSRVKRAAVAVGGGSLVGVGGVLMVTPLHPLGHAMVVGGGVALSTEFEAPRRALDRFRTSNFANRFRRRWGGQQAQQQRSSSYDAGNDEPEVPDEKETAATTTKQSGDTKSAD